MKPKNNDMFCNIATYKFVSLDELKLPSLCKQLKRVASGLEIKGTILLGTEGINLFLAGAKDSITKFQDHLQTLPEFQDLPYKYSYSNFIPFQKLFVKVRNEIVTFKQLGIAPQEFTAPHLPPEQLKEWFDCDRDMIVLDTRNTFEYDMGTFEQATHLKIDNFREFPEALKNFPESDKDKPIVTFCTGGIRCEKAAAYLLKQGFKEVYQLQGGILNYFERCGGEHYQGDCFVFDDRVALNSRLEPCATDDD
jgi:UPF0176 protein